MGDPERPIENEEGKKLLTIIGYGEYIGKVLPLSKGGSILAEEFPDFCRKHDKDGTNGLIDEVLDEEFPDRDTSIADLREHFDYFTGRANQPNS